MTTPAVVFGDPEATIRTRLVTLMAERPETYAADTVTVDFPTAALAGDATHLQVELESTDVTDYPVRERSQVRITAYAAPGKRSNAKNLASLAQGLVLSVPGTFPQAGRSDVVKDPATGNLMVWFLVRVDMRATVLT